MKYVLIVRRGTGELILSRTVGVRAETASPAEMEAEAIEVMARELTDQARALRAGKAA